MADLVKIQRVYKNFYDSSLKHLFCVEPIFPPCLIKKLLTKRKKKRTNILCNKSALPVSTRTLVENSAIEPCAKVHQPAP